MTNTDQTINALATDLLKTVVRSGVLDKHPERLDKAVTVMREELKSFLFDAKYADERALAMTGGTQLAIASLRANCIARIAA